MLQISTLEDYKKESKDKNSAGLLSNPQDLCNSYHKPISETERCYIFYEHKQLSTRDSALYNIVWGNLHRKYDQDS